MALLARHDGMTPDQRKSRDVVIEEGRSAPTGFAVALRAAIAELAGVGVVSSMAGHACGRELVAIEIARVARIALDLRVRGSQRKPCCPVVVKANRAPLVLIVAAGAFCAVASGVNVLK